MAKITCDAAITKVSKGPKADVTFVANLILDSGQLATLNSMNFGPNAGEIEIEIRQLQDPLPGTMAIEDEPAAIEEDAIAETRRRKPGKNL